MLCGQIGGKESITQFVVCMHVCSHSLGFLQDNLRNLVRLFWNQTFTWFSLRPSFVASCILSVTQKKSTASFQSADLGILTRPYQWFLSVEVDGEEHTLHWYLLEFWGLGSSLTVAEDVHVAVE